MQESLRITFTTLEHEVFRVLLLDTHHRLQSLLPAVLVEY